MLRSRAVHRLRWLAAGSLLAVALVHCDDSDGSTPDYGPTGTPSVRVVYGFDKEGNPVSPPPDWCTVIGDSADDPRSRVPIALEVTEVTLRPPGLCGVQKQCGYAQLSVVCAPTPGEGGAGGESGAGGAGGEEGEQLPCPGVVNATSAAEVIEADFTKLADRYGPRTFRVDIIAESTGEVLLDKNGKKVSTPLFTLTTVADACPGQGGSGGSGSG
ncbi:MAG: hypothetical protein WKG00_23425, partial [Polyangiaceae bacterium]